MNRAERNMFRLATETIDNLTADLERLKRENATLKGQLTKERNKRKAAEAALASEYEGV